MSALSGKWKIRSDRIEFYRENKIMGSRQILGNTIRGYNCVKREGAKIVKTLEVSVPVESTTSRSPMRVRRQRRVGSPSFSRSGKTSPVVQVTPIKPVTKLKKITLWSDYISPKNDLFNLKIEKDGTFSMVDLEGKWEIENGFVKIFKDNGEEMLNGGNVRGNNIIFERFEYGNRMIWIFVKQD